MECIMITHQKATAICKKELNGRKVPPANEAYLLKTGAKLFYVGKGKYMVGGYAADGSDVEPYR